MIGFRLIKTLLVVSLGFSISACDDPKTITSESGRFYFTNDSSESLIFFIDYQPIVIPHQGVGSILLRPGPHLMTTMSGKAVQFIVYPGNKGGILNPNKQIYYTYSFVHGTEGIPSIHHLKKQSLVVNGYLLNGRINSSNDYIIDNNVFNCDFHVGEAVPEEINSSTTVSQVKTKCLTHKELVDLIHQEDGLISQLIVKKMVNHANQSVTVHFDYPLTQPDFSDEALQLHAQEVVNLIDSFRRSLDPQRKQFYYNQYHNKISHMAIIYSQMGSDRSSLQEKRKYAEFMQQTRAIFGAGTLMYH
ncbi:hypothetical protein AB7W88_00850 [Providencia vermicola]|uniref:Lipoprotein n=3 Tax=Providencia TaxID=586 RepID=A0AAI9HZV9_PROST|nr:MULTISPECIES: hypothetical protein [Providencia]ELR5042931.1 hypothetical protein [Providencia rettgeri]ELR5035654.1 hypothetical protein [Providencia stuartii]ELR5119855.1 hypothetical protein [Providencia stuartii]ELR5141603.1 hypothetical protein [Providencia stuartii]ELR5290956.1 hypothetical protein [Providencia stuartii]